MGNVLDSTSASLSTVSAQSTVAATGSAYCASLGVLAGGNRMPTQEGVATSTCSASCVGGSSLRSLTVAGTAHGGTPPQQQPAHLWIQGCINLVKQVERSRVTALDGEDERQGHQRLLPA